MSPVDDKTLEPGEPDEPLFDASIRRALAQAPDRAVLPDWRIRQAVLDHAHDAISASEDLRSASRERAPWWSLGWWRHKVGVSGATPWNAALATLMVAVLVTVMWKREPVPGPQLDEPAMPASKDREEAKKESAAPELEKRAAPSASEASAPTAQSSPAPGRASGPVPAAPQVAAPAPAPVRPSTQAPVQAPTPAAPVAPDVPATMAPPLVPAPAPPLAEAQAPIPAQPAGAASKARSPKDAASTAAPAPVAPMAPAPDALADRRRSDPADATSAVAPRGSADASRLAGGAARQQAPATAAPLAPSNVPGAAGVAGASGAAGAAGAPGAPASPSARNEAAFMPDFTSLSRWTELRVANINGDVRVVPRAQVGELGLLMTSAAIMAVGAPPLRSVPEWRVTLERRGQVLAVLEVGRNDVRWTEGKQPPTTGAPPAEAVDALRGALRQAVRSGSSASPTPAAPPVQAPESSGASQRLPYAPLAPPAIPSNIPLTPPAAERAAPPAVPAPPPAEPQPSQE